MEFDFNLLLKIFRSEFEGIENYPHLFRLLERQGLIRHIRDEVFAFKNETTCTVCI